VTSATLQFAVQLMTGIGGLLLPVFVVVTPFSIMRRRLF